MKCDWFVRGRPLCLQYRGISENGQGKLSTRVIRYGEMKNVTISRSKDGSPMEKYATFDLDKEDAWPVLEQDVVDDLRNGFVNCHFINSSDGYRYWIDDGSNLQTGEKQI